MERSKFFSLDWKDFGKGLITAVFAAVITFAYQAIALPDFWSLNTLKGAGLAAAAALLGYLTKNLFTNAKGEMAPDK